MNKRQRAKLNKTIIVKNILNPIKKAGFHIHASFGDGYFLFTFGKNTVCHFTVDELPMIKFGVWLNYDKEHSYVIFAEDCLHMDKFKPSRCYNFDNTQEVIDLIRNYKDKRISWKNIICDIFDNDWVEDGQSDEDYYNQYLKEYDEWLFERTHSYCNREEWKIANEQLDNVLDWMKNNKYIEVVIVSKNLPYFKSPYGIDWVYSNEIDKLSDEEFSKIDHEIYMNIKYDDNNKSTYLTSYCTCIMNSKLSWKEMVKNITDKRGNLKENLYFAKGSLKDFHD